MPLSRIPVAAEPVADQLDSSTRAAIPNANILKEAIAQGGLREVDLSLVKFEDLWDSYDLTAAYLAQALATKSPAEIDQLTIRVTEITSQHVNQTTADQAKYTRVFLQFFKQYLMSAPQAERRVSAHVTRIVTG